MSSVEQREALVRSTLIQRIERVDLRVRDIDSTLALYRDVVGLHVVEQGPHHAFLGDGSGRVFLSFDSTGVSGPAVSSATGLFHTAIRFPSRASLGDVLARLAHAGLEVGAGDHLVSEALYVNDPDLNGVELYWDRPAERWPGPTETMMVPMATLPVDLDALLKDGKGSAAVGQPVPQGTDIGHVHLQASDIAATTRFYTQTLGLDQTGTLTGSAAFFSSNGYHHHIGTNVWRSRHGRPAGADRAGLARVHFSVADPQELSELSRRLDDPAVSSGSKPTEKLVVQDPDGIELVFSLRDAAAG